MSANVTTPPTDNQAHLDSTDVPAISGIPKAACKQCRARKVKCDRIEPSCRACTRLNFDCSFGGHVIVESPGVNALTGLTQAGTKRKRSRQACTGCKAVKAKCAGGNPCERCLARGVRCEQSTEHRRQDGSQESWLGPSPDYMALSTPGTMGSFSSSASALHDKPVVRRYLEAYLDSRSLSGCDVFLKPFVLADWSKGKLNSVLLKVMVASGMRILDRHPEAQSRARDWIREAQEETLRHIGRQSIAQLQVLVVIIRFSYAVGDLAAAWNLLSLAARMAFTMRLNWEDESLSPVTQESRRRLVWAIYLIDRRFSGGVEDLAVCPLERMKIRLPSDDHSFRRGIRSEAGFLDGSSDDKTGTMDILSYHVRVSASRERVLRYTKGVRRNGTSPINSRNEIEILHCELDKFGKNLPEDLKPTSERLLLMVHSDDAGEYIILHTMWLLCYCDLYRFLIPGIRESVSKEAMENTPAEFISHCQRNCLEKAIRLCDFWFEIYQLEFARDINDMFFAISVYQVCQIISHLQHLLPDEGSHSVENLKARLEGALQLASSLHIPFRRSASCLKASERLVRTLGQGMAVSSRPSSVDEPENQHHLPSKHSFISTMSRRPHELEEDEVSDSAATAQLAPNNRHTNEYGFRGSVASQPEIPGFGASDGLPATLADQGETAPWDPFDMQMNDYYDPELGELLMSMAR